MLIVTAATPTKQDEGRGPRASVASVRGMGSEPPKRRTTVAAWTAVGIALGAAVGTAVGGLSVGVAMGAGLGVALGASRSRP